MGIKSLNPMLKKQSPEAFFNVPIGDFSGKRIAVDANNWAYMAMSGARKKVIKKTDLANQKPDQMEIKREFYLNLINFVTGWLYHGITCVFVFDGKHPPEKFEEQAKRKKSKVSARQEIEDLYKKLENIDLEFPGDIVEQLKKKLCNYTTLSFEDLDLLKTITKIIGIPTLQAEGDGEKLCSMLCIEGKVAAVFSTDTDNLVYGCPLLITGFSDSCSYDEYGQRISHLDCVRIDKILLNMKISHSLFVDLCIMSGCDYNSNMPGYGTIKSLGLLQKHGSIENLSNKMDISCLKHERCRELFKRVESSKLTEDELILNVDKTSIASSREYLEMVGIAGQINRLVDIYQKIPIPLDGTLDNLKIKTLSECVPRKVIAEIKTKFVNLIVVE
jgi:flap endonuclease-1